MGKKRLTDVADTDLYFHLISPKNFLVFVHGTKVTDSRLQFEIYIRYVYATMG